MNFNPSFPFNVPATILVAQTRIVNGIPTKTYTEGDTIMVSAKSYGGTEKVVNDRYVVEDTLVIETWYYPQIKADTVLRLLDDGSEWEVINSPENIARMNRYLRFKVRRIRGGA